MEKQKKILQKQHHHLKVIIHKKMIILKIKKKIKSKDILIVNLTKIPIIYQIKIMNYFQKLEKKIRGK